jgi:Tfp pilus assembly protein PilV
MARLQQRCNRASGFAYLEVLVAALVLAVCAVPAANAIKNGLDAGSAGQAKAAELRCLRNRMETVLAEPYASLNSAAGTGTGTSNYSLPPDADCLGRQVTITRTQFDGQNITPLPASASASQQDLALLLVKVALVDSAGKPASDYTFSTVVAR